MGGQLAPPHAPLASLGGLGRAGAAGLPAGLPVYFGADSGGLGCQRIVHPLMPCLAVGRWPSVRRRSQGRR